VDVTGLGAAYLNDFQSGGGLINRDKNSGNDDFAEMLKRTAASQSTDNDPASTSSRIAKIDKTDKLYEQCQELEIFLVKTLVSSMRSTIQKSGLVDEGFAGKMYEDMLYDEYARSFTKSANFGMAEMAYLELTGQRGKSAPNT
jgi:flagellar protein FlgJ